nr:MAG TPA: bifunctional HTH-domain containing protein/aminotransferase [Caudoviricetes sp.]
MIVIKITTADRLNQLLLERNLKQVDILELCKPYCKKYNVKLNKNDLSQYISNKYSPSQEKLTILSMALKVNEVWLMGYDVPSGIDALKNLEQNLSKEAELQNSIEQTYGKATLELINDFQKLDEVDKIKITERIATLLEDEKYSFKKESLNA